VLTYTVAVKFYFMFVFSVTCARTVQLNRSSQTKMVQLRILTVTGAPNNGMKVRHRMGVSKFT